MSEIYILRDDNNIVGVFNSLVMAKNSSYLKTRSKSFSKKMLKLDKWLVNSGTSVAVSTDLLFD